MNSIRKTAYLLGATSLLLGTGQTAQAVDYNGTLAFDANPPTEITFQGPFGDITGDVGVDLQRFDLGSALDGSSINITFTTHNSYKTDSTALALVFATDANNAIVSDPTSLAGFVNPSTDVTSFLDEHVAGWTYYAWGDVLGNNSTVDVSAIFNPPMAFTAGTHYYAFVAGGSAYRGGVLSDTSVGYTLSVSAVPEPESWAMMMAGLGMIGLYLRRRRAG